MSAPTWSSSWRSCLGQACAFHPGLSELRSLSSFYCSGCGLRCAVKGGGIELDLVGATRRRSRLDDRCDSQRPPARGCRRRLAGAALPVVVAVEYPAEPECTKTRQPLHPPLAGAEGPRETLPAPRAHTRIDCFRAIVNRHDADQRDLDVPATGRTTIVIGVERHRPIMAARTERRPTRTTDRRARPPATAADLGCQEDVVERRLGAASPKRCGRGE